MPLELSSVEEPVLHFTYVAAFRSVAACARPPPSRHCVSRAARRPTQSKKAVCLSRSANTIEAPILSRRRIASRYGSDADSRFPSGAPMFWSRVTGVPLPKADPTPPDQRRRHVAHGPRCPCLHASAVEGSGAKRPVAKGGPITPCEGRCRRCQQATRTRVAL